MAVVPATPGTFADRLEASLWSIDLPGSTGLEEAAAAFLAAAEVARSA